MAAASAPFTLDRGRIRLADTVLVYLQRAFAAPEPHPAGVPARSYGVAPMSVSPAGTVWAAVAPGEAVWLGFQAITRARPATVRVRLDVPEPLDAVTGAPWEEALVDDPRNHLNCPPDHWLSGVRQPDGHRMFGLGAASADAQVLEQLTVFAWGSTPVPVMIRLVSPAAFTQLTGEVPPPIDVDSAYRGWRLP